MVFAIQYIRCFKNFCGSANILLQIPSKMENKMKKILSPVYSLKLKNIVLFLTRGLIFFFFVNGHIHNVASTLLNVVKIYIENYNVVSTLSNVVQINVEIANVVNFNVDVRNVVSTLI